jgi:hypothetical protein
MASTKHAYFSNLSQHKISGCYKKGASDVSIQVHIAATVGAQNGRVFASFVNPVQCSEVAWCGEGKTHTISLSYHMQ